MSVGRVLASVVCVGAVAGCTLLAVNLSRAATADGPAGTPSDVASVAGPMTSRPTLPATAEGQLLAPSSAAVRPAAGPSARPARTASTVPPASTPPRSAAVAQSPSVTHAARPAPATTVPAGTPSRATHAPAARTTAPPHPAPSPSAAPRAPVRHLTVGRALPLHFGTGSATRVITVVASASYHTTATLQAWVKAPGGGWLKHGSAVTAHVGSQGLTRQPSESKSATPIGSFTLTRAFGHDPNPGTRLPYVHTNPSYWWISQSGPLYNTMQSCWSNCAFRQGNPNEHLYYETPYYDYAVVIDYNTRNAGPVRQGAGSAFFLHVTDGRPTAGCVAIPASRLVPLMRWLAPGAHPRILIGVA